MSITAETRREAHREIKRKAPPRWAMIYNYLREKGPSTNEEIRDGLGLRDMNDVRPRVNELMEKGLVREAGKRVGRTGRRSTVWEAIEKAANGGKGEMGHDT